MKMPIIFLMIRIWKYQQWYYLVHVLSPTARHAFPRILFTVRHTVSFFQPIHPIFCDLWTPQAKGLEDTNQGSWFVRRQACRDMPWLSVCWKPGLLPTHPPNEISAHLHAQRWSHMEVPSSCRCVVRGMFLNSSRWVQLAWPRGKSVHPWSQATACQVKTATSQNVAGRSPSLKSADQIGVLVVTVPKLSVATTYIRNTPSHHCMIEVQDKCHNRPEHAIITTCNAVHTWKPL